MSSDQIQIKGVDFVYVPTDNFESSVKFYGELLGLPESARYGSMPGAEFETGNLTLAVIQSDAFGMEFAPHKSPIALHVDDVAATRAALEAQGVQFAHQIDSGVCHMAFFSDPAGNGLMLHNRYAPRK